MCGVLPRPIRESTGLSYRLKLLALLICATATFALLNTGYSALNTLSRLDVVEAQRDQWQRPAEIVQALAIKPGDTVAEIGCGSGYFALKLSAAVGKAGRVYAEDIRRLPLVFLWFRTILKNDPNITVVHGEEGDPHLRAQPVNEALIANTYHELADPQAMLAYMRQALISGGRLVVVDRAPNSARRDEDPLAEHEISAERVESELRAAKFEITAREDDFIGKDPDNENWWLIVARRP
jgi:ubiquinone/menaquinone biosynthesis C-methylase UbiE